MNIHNFASSMSSVLATNSMLQSVSVNPTIPTVIASSYVSKDIIGQLGSLFYNFKFGKNADTHPMKYVGFGVLLQQASYYLDTISPLQEAIYILPILGLSSLFKNIAFTSIGSVSANKLQKYSNGNIGQLYSRIASINTISSSLGMMAGLGLIYYVPSWEVRTYLCMPILSFISFVAVRKAVE